MKVIRPTLQVIIQHLMFGKSIDKATDSARIHHQLVPNVLRVDPGITEVSDIHPPRHKEKSLTEAIGLQVN